MRKYNLVQKQDLNFYLAIPFGLLVKPFANDNFGSTLMLVVHIANISQNH
jgi:hypothetical protein